MPLYTYKCKSCGKTFEQFNSIENRDAPTLEPCTCEKGAGQIIRCLPTPQTKIDSHVRLHKLANDKTPGFAARMQQIRRNAGRSTTMQKREHV